MNILIIGSGGREHALGHKIKENSEIKNLYFAPGNPGTALLGKNIDIAVDSLDKLLAFAKENKIDLTIVGPELPLSLGIVDLFKSNGLKIFGPDKAGAMLESSKVFSKNFMLKYDIPTAGYAVFSSADDAENYIQSANFPLVIKADGLAAGKGVIICQNLEEAQKALDDMMKEQIFGKSGSTVVVEEFLTGKEVSLICFSDTKTIVPMASASDYKRAYDDDAGPNTGGMGSISPSFYYEEGMADEIVQKTLLGIQKEGFDFHGVIYIGLMMTAEGPKVIEYNVRFGDPETQALIPRLKTDLTKIILMAIDEKLSDIKIEWSDEKCVTVVIAAEGYPGKPKSGCEIKLPKAEDVLVFHAGTKEENGKLLSAGGRVLGISALAKDMESARKKVYKYIDEIDFKESFHRKDIGKQ